MGLPEICSSTRFGRRVVGGEIPQHIVCEDTKPSPSQAQTSFVLVVLTFVMTLVAVCFGAKAQIGLLNFNAIERTLITTFYIHTTCALKKLFSTARQALALWLVSTARQSPPTTLVEATSSFSFFEKALDCSDLIDCSVWVIGDGGRRPQSH